MDLDGCCGLLEHPQSVRGCTFGMGHAGKCSWSSRPEGFHLFGGITQQEIDVKASQGSPAALVLQALKGK